MKRYALRHCDSGPPKGTEGKRKEINTIEGGACQNAGPHRAGSVTVEVAELNCYDLFYACAWKASMVLVYFTELLESLS